MLLLTVLLLGPLAGWLSARVMLDDAGFSSAQDVAGWREVKNIAGSFAGTYESGHYLARGQLPPPQHVRQFVRHKDDEGNSLRSDCATRVEGVSPPSRWWQLNADFRSGTRAISSGTIIGEGGGTFSVTLWNAVVSGNWLELSGSEDYALRLIVHEADGDAEKSLPLPGVRRMWC